MRRHPSDTAALPAVCRSDARLSARGTDLATLQCDGLAANRGDVVSLKRGHARQRARRRDTI
eukprot:426813-Pleurochrysis_carterae.AAC.1